MNAPSSLVEQESAGGVYRIRLNRPGKRNALSRELIAQLTAAVRTAVATPGVRVLELSAGGSVFCAGMDLAEMQQRALSPDADGQWQEDTRQYHDLLCAVLEAEVPVVACLPGPALAGGLGLVLACDLVIAADSAFFSLPEPKRGITAAVVTPLLTYRLGVSRSSWLLLSGRSLNAAEAATAGLCHLVVPADSLEAAGQDLLNSVLSGAPQALAVTKRQLLHSAGTGLREQLEQAREVSATARSTSEAREGLAAFLEKRPPAWQPEPRTPGE